MNNHNLTYKEYIFLDNRKSLQKTTDESPHPVIVLSLFTPSRNIFTFEVKRSKDILITSCSTRPNHQVASL